MLIEARGTNGLQLTRSFEARTWAWKGSENGFLSRARVLFVNGHTVLQGDVRGGRENGVQCGADGGRVGTPCAWRLGCHGEDLVGLLVPGIDLM